MVLRIMTPCDLKRNNGRFGENYCFLSVQVNVEVAGTSVKSAIRYGTTGCHKAGHRQFSIVLSAPSSSYCIHLKQFAQ